MSSRSRQGNGLLGGYKRPSLASTSSLTALTERQRNNDIFRCHLAWLNDTVSSEKAKVANYLKWLSVWSDMSASSSTFVGLSSSESSSASSSGPPRCTFGKLHFEKITGNELIRASPTRLYSRREGKMIYLIVTMFSNLKISSLISSELSRDILLLIC